ncbi:uncharacterized protein LY79DRAFT_410159 [Colletotrichum navitas]|uniref:Uncharacterized protein n=1 Tax=Colletotrichum navitas TaxID=681940 RepID=A0AAD8PNY3_9PEZI|nr:uncharacterized protein LY79DRAFT_410159 [Colletotrichum navitas]KAK1573542.1 hypothetical protein LY79DRAFT_410159 [Colletotrichum navitas]
MSDVAASSELQAEWRQYCRIQTQAGSEDGSQKLRDSSSSPRLPPPPSRPSSPALPLRPRRPRVSLQRGCANEVSTASLSACRPNKLLAAGNVCAWFPAFLLSPHVARAAAASSASARKLQPARRGRGQGRRCRGWRPVVTGQGGVDAGGSVCHFQTYSGQIPPLPLDGEGLLCECWGNQNGKPS